MVLFHERSTPLLFHFMRHFFGSGSGRVPQYRLQRSKTLSVKYECHFLRREGENQPAPGKSAGPFSGSRRTDLRAAGPADENSGPYQQRLCPALANFACFRDG